MGLFSSFQSEETRRAEEVRTGARAPDRSERRKCWDARDAYFGCLDRNTIVDAVKDDDKARKACPAEDAVFERDCATAWNPNAQSGSTNALPARQVKYFKQWRVADIQKKQRIAQLEAENAIKMDVTTTFADQTAAPPTKGATSKGDLQDMLASRRK
ncbi:oxidoreductase-like protein [Colletotrichum tofieldiae]|nr:oxidoreductase-like protein [Colletotrichum tofieldiae]GKT71973.1 oxidoreductase-like protein [Colletotrichum tofieldiae]